MAQPGKVPSAPGRASPRNGEALSISESEGVDERAARRSPAAGEAALECGLTISEIGARRAGAVGGAGELPRAAGAAGEAGPEVGHRLLAAGAPLIATAGGARGRRRATAFTARRERRLAVRETRARVAQAPGETLESPPTARTCGRTAASVGDDALDARLCGAGAIALTRARSGRRATRLRAILKVTGALPSGGVKRVAACAHGFTPIRGAPRGEPTRAEDGDACMLAGRLRRLAHRSAGPRIRRTGKHGERSCDRCESKKSSVHSFSS